MPEFGSNRARRARPPSTTTRISGMVNDVSAIEVANTTLRASRWRQSRPLRRKLHRAKQRPHLTIRQPRQHRLHPTDFPLTGQKHQHPALGLLNRLPHQPGHPRLKPQRRIRHPPQPARLHRIGPPHRGHHRRIAHQRGNRSLHPASPTSPPAPDRRAKPREFPRPKPAPDRHSKTARETRQRSARRHPSSPGSLWIIRVKIPSVTTSIRVALARPSPRRESGSPPFAPTASPKVSAIRSAAARAAKRRGSSITIRPAINPEASRSSGTNVVLPAPVVPAKPPSRAPQPLRAPPPTHLLSAI